MPLRVEKPMFSSRRVRVAPAGDEGRALVQCLCCGGREFDFRPVLWPKLVEQWQLSPEEAETIDRQQGRACRACGASLRSNALALAVMRFYGFGGTFAEWVATRQARRLVVLELNGAGHLTQFLRRLPGHVETAYPDTDLTAMRFAEGSFDLVLHSDTLEHVAEPVRGLAECRRVLRPGGACCFTIPIVVGRPTRSRAGLEPSYHGGPADEKADYVVHTEYGADAWRHVMEAGFAECRLVAAEYPAALALVAVP